MERTTVYLEGSLKRLLKEEAARRGQTEASLLREAVAEYLTRTRRQPIRPVGRSQDGGVARDVDAALGALGFGKT